MPKRSLWNQLTAFSEANPLQIKLERKATGKITDAKSGRNIFSSEHPYGGEETKPPAPRGRATIPPGASVGIPGLRPFAEAVVGAAALRRAQAARPRQPSEHQAAEQTHHDPHGYLRMGRTPGL